VGAVALDTSGELATAISTGGMSMKSYGRVGDSAIIGAGFYATRNVAVCCTGNGEAFMRCAVAKDVTALMEYKGLSVIEAAQQAIKNGERLIGPVDFEGGLIAVDAHGHISLDFFNSRGMYRGSVTSQQEAQVKVWRD
jgi:beta-aspartyl-peptidase (threonine type)